MNEEGILLDIEVLNYLWKTSVMYISGHYEFEINLTYRNENGKFIKKIIYRRFSDFEILHDGLVKINPGSRIPKLPEKSIWCNIYINNDNALEKRKNQIGDYLKYILLHKFLKNNPIFQIFLSDELEEYKNYFSRNKKGIDTKKIIEFLKSVKKNYLPKSINKIFSPFGINNKEILFTCTSLENNKFIRNQINQKEYIIFDFENEKENVLRLDRGVSDLITTMEKYINLFEERTNSLKIISDITKNLDNTVLSIKSFQKFYNSGGLSDKNIIKYNNFGLEKECLYEKLFEKNRCYKDNINSNILDKLKIYSEELNSLKEIIKRKDDLMQENKMSSDIFDYIDAINSRKYSSNSIQNNITCKKETEFYNDFLEEEEFNDVKNVFQSEGNGADMRLLNRARERSLSLNEYITSNSCPDIQNLINQYILEFREEILSFKENKEKEIVNILKKFFNYKMQLLNDMTTNAFENINNY